MQFTTHQLFGATAAIAVLCAISAWLHKTAHDLSWGWIPTLIPPSTSMIGFGLLLLPIYLTLIVMIFMNAPRPYTAIIFLGLQIFGLTVDISYWSNGIKLVTALFVVAIAMAIEIYVRKLPRNYVYYSGLSFALTAVWYFAAIGVAASAAI